MTASSKLQGLQLEGGWRVLSAITRPEGATGGQFSYSYEVQNINGKKGFLKAFDFSSAFENGVDTLAALTNLSLSFMNERDILMHCKERGHTKVSLPLADGQIQVPNYSPMEGKVYYLVFDMAEGDIRCQIDLSNRGDTLWCLSVLKDTCGGLWQVHRDMIAHQDLKPSNVLIYSRGDKCRVADFGRASRRGSIAPHDHMSFPGDRTYQPPEFMYGYEDPDFVKRRIGCDLYMLGNICCYLFSGVNISQLLMSRLHVQYSPNAWSGTYQQVLPYLIDAFTIVLEDIGPSIDEIIRAQVLSLIRQLCSPDLERRGHPRGLGKGDQFSLERYVSELDLLYNRTAIRLRMKKAS